MAETSSARPKSSLLLLIWAASFVAAICVRVRDLTSYGLWMDEVYSVRFARAPWGELFQQSAADAVHPPLFYIVLKIWTAIGGDSLLWLKVLPLLFAIGAIVAVYFLTRELRLSHTEFTITLVIISLNAFLIYYAQELRMYSMLMLFSVMSIWAFSRFTNDRGPYPAATLLIVNLLLIYTHYFGWLTVAGEGAALLILHRRHMKTFICHCLVLVFAFLPWVLTVAKVLSNGRTQGGNLNWIDLPGLQAVPVFLADLNGQITGVRSTISVGLLVFLVPVAIWIWQSRRELSERRLAILLSVLAAAPLGVAFVASQLAAASVWVDRYLIASAAPYYLLLSVGASRISPSFLSRVFTTLIIAWAVGAGAWNLYTRRDRVDWNSISAAITSRPANIYATEPWTAMPLEEATHRRTTELAHVRTVADLTDIHDQRFWLVYRQSTWNSQSSVDHVIESRGCSSEATFTDRSNFETVHAVLVRCHPPGA